MDDPDGQELLSMELKGKKKKGKKKVDVSQLDAEIDKIAAQGSGTLETSSNIQKPSPLVDIPQTTGGLEPSLDDEFGLNLTGKKKKKKKTPKIGDEGLLDLVPPQDIIQQGQSLEPPQMIPVNPLELIEEAPQIPSIDYDLPLKKKKRKPNIVFEGFEEILAVEEEEEWDVEDIEAMETSPWADTDRDYTYEELLDRVFNIMKQKNPAMVDRKTKLVMKPPQVMRVGARRTTFANFTDICKLLHRQPKHVFAFLLAELGTSGSIDGNNHLIIKGRFQQKQIESVLKRYIKEYVTCHTCRSPATILQRENRLFFLQCETCGSKCSVQSVKSGFQAVTNRKQMRSKQV